MHADATTPAEPLDAVAILSNGNGLPRKPGGSASAISFSRPAQRSLAFRPAWSLSHLKVTRYTRVLQRICHLLRRPGCFRPSDRLAGWDSHPLEIADFHGILVFSESHETYDLMTLFCDPPPLRLLSAERPIGRVGFMILSHLRLSRIKRRKPCKPPLTQTRLQSGTSR